MILDGDYFFPLVCISGAVGSLTRAEYGWITLGVLWLVCYIFSQAVQESAEVLSGNV